MSEQSHIPAFKYPDLWAYHLGVAGEGPHAPNWQDKPHRLVYDLTRIAAAQREQNAELLAACKAVAGVFQDYEDIPLYAQKCIAAVKQAQGKK